MIATLPPSFDLPKTTWRPLVYHTLFHGPHLSHKQETVNRTCLETGLFVQKIEQCLLLYAYLRIGGERLGLVQDKE